MAPIKAIANGLALAVMLAAGTAAQFARAQQTDGAPPMAVPRDGRFHVWLTDDSHLVARLEVGDALTLDSAVGHVKVPTLKIDRIDFHSQRPQATVCFRNGDRLTGKVALEKMKFKTLWGEAEIEVQHIVEIVSHETYKRENEPVPYFPPGPDAIPIPGTEPAAPVELPPPAF